MKIDHILAEADEHLRRRLASNAAVDVRLARKIFVEMPDISDGVAEKDGTILARSGRLDRGVGGTVAAEFAEVVAQRERLRVAVFLSGLVGSKRLRCLLGQG